MVCAVFNKLLFVRMSGIVTKRQLFKVRLCFVHIITAGDDTDEKQENPGQSNVPTLSTSSLSHLQAFNIISHTHLDTITVLGSS